MQDFTLCELVYGGRHSPAKRALEEFAAQLIICHGQTVFQVNFVLRQKKQSGRKRKRDKKWLKRKSWRKSEKKERYMIRNGSLSEYIGVNILNEFHIS